jgi:hypothetical protein
MAWVANSRLGMLMGFAAPFPGEKVVSGWRGTGQLLVGPMILMPADRHFQIFMQAGPCCPLRHTPEA